MVGLKVKSFAIRWRIFCYKISSKHLLLFEDNLDNDEVGRGATQKIMMIARCNYQCFDNHPMNFKDVNDELIHKSLLLSTDLWIWQMNHSYPIGYKIM